jgi:hypothetical protein
MVDSSLLYKMGIIMKEGLLKYLGFGIIFGIILTKAEVVSWWRIQEMFRLGSFHMYGVIGSAVVTGAVSIFLMKKMNIKTISGENIVYTLKEFNRGTIIGGILFGLGWAITGACPGPLYSLVGAGYWSILLVILGALIGVYLFGWLNEKFNLSK